jgi:hypothetical protein
MTPYEAQSIEVARSALAASIFADVIAGIAVLAVIAGSIFAYLTLRAILQQLKGAQWSTLLSLEQDMAGRGDKFHELYKKIKASPTLAPDEECNAAKESYFNAIDRFASLVLNGQFPQSELKQDYQELIKETIRGFPADFAAGTSYRKIVKLHDKWEDGK